LALEHCSKQIPESQFGSDLPAPVALQTVAGPGKRSPGND
jgi:hypothetical protein